jgi:c-di-GMP-binding flagellar brake protein YcgR
VAKKDSTAERRKHLRYQIKECTFSAKMHLGEIIDISMGGLSFRYVDTGLSHSNPPDIINGSSVLFGNDDLCLHDLPYKIISAHAIGTGLSPVRRCGVQFEKLSAKQIAQLEQFILANMAENEEKMESC